MTNSEEIILINITGKDRPGLTATLAGVLAQYHLNILDIGQAVIHDYLSLGILVEIPVEHQSSSVLKDLLFAGHSLQVSITFTPIELDRYEQWVSEKGKDRRIITLLGRHLTAEQIAEVAAAVAAHNLNIDVITRLSGRISLLDRQSFPNACVQFSVTGQLDDPATLRGRLLQIASDKRVDISIQRDDIYRLNRRLVVFDMDSTLFQVEVIDELAKVAGVGEQVAAVTEAAMRGDIDYRESVIRRVALLKGLDERVLAQVAAGLQLTEGAEQVLHSLNQLGYKTGIISGGFKYFGLNLQKKLGIDYLYANDLEIQEGKLTGNLVGEIIDGPKKADLLKSIALIENIRLEQTVAVGDGANDLPMLSIAGLGVAFHAKPIVKEKAQRSISNVDLDGLLYLIGISEREIH